ncbi:PilZ domain-containing protein [Nisaea denitrificans]|uniref:PilZ domain-containing protein n=1 Tax=Nisaea denitrificans TaxID=390877 RepID=UPI000426E011|nr:PilZ domain-containing protein [Nisaea denitrificans]
MPDLHPDQTKTLSEGLSNIQGQAERLLGKMSDEKSASQVADLLHELAALRLLVDLPQEGDRRRDLRVPRRDISIFRIDGKDVDCAIEDLSIGGAYIVADWPILPDTEIELNIPEAGTIAARVVSSTENGVHVQFDNISDPQLIAIANSMRAHYTK